MGTITHSGCAGSLLDDLGTETIGTVTMAKPARQHARRSWAAILLLLPFIGGCVTQASLDAPAYSPWGIAFYSMFVATIIAFVVINLALNNLIGLFYSGLFAGFLATLWALEGGLTAFGFSGAVDTSASYSLAIVSIAFGFYTAERSIDPRQEMKRARTAMTLLAGLSLLVLLPVWMVPGQWLSYITLGLALLMAAAHFVATRTWAMHDDSPQQVPRVAVILFGVAMVVMVVLAVSRGAGDAAIASLVQRLLYAVVTASAMTAVLMALIDVRKARDAAMQESLRAARRDAETNANLLEMERNYARARDIAARHSRALSEASHDIRQPIASMRAELDALRKQAPIDVLTRLGQVLDHMDSLTGELSRSASRPGETGLHGEMEQEVLPISLLFDTLDRMFSGEASTARIKLRFVPSGVSVVAPPLALIRLTGNLISNAITHAEPSAILVGLRRRGRRVRLDIIDNGGGFEDGDAERAFQSGVKRKASPGAGLGLSIVKDLSGTYDIPVDVWSEPGAGTCFSIWLRPA
ncbi:sensor histidine kinase [Henriciella mobilis]|nr:sensor histidine kinase [Henriciella mobilis]RIJ19314.1 sensor histidine kinase [Henriciella mobilis]